MWIYIYIFLIYSYIYKIQDKQDMMKTSFRGDNERSSSGSTCFPVLVHHALIASTPEISNRGVKGVK